MALGNFVVKVNDPLGKIHDITVTNVASQAAAEKHIKFLQSLNKPDGPQYITEGEIVSSAPATKADLDSKPKDPNERELA